MPWFSHSLDSTRLFHSQFKPAQHTRPTKRSTDTGHKKTASPEASSIAYTHHQGALISRSEIRRVHHLVRRKPLAFARAATGGSPWRCQVEPRARCAGGGACKMNGGSSASDRTLSSPARVHCVHARGGSRRTRARAVSRPRGFRRSWSRLGSPSEERPRTDRLRAAQSHGRCRG